MATITSAEITSYAEGAFNTLTAIANITGVDDDGMGNDQICLEVFDDFFILVAIQCLSVPVGSSSNINFSLSWTTPVSHSDPGIGVYLRDEELGQTLGFLDTLTIGMTPISLDGITLVPAPLKVENIPAISDISFLLTVIIILFVTLQHFKYHKES